MNIILNKAFVAEAAILANRIVKFGAADGQVLQAAAAGDMSIGVHSCGYDAAINERVEITTHGIAEVKLGGVVTRGQPITADATGQGVAAAPAVAVNNRVIGIAMASGVAGDVIDVLLAQSTLQG